MAGGQVALVFPQRPRWAVPTRSQHLTFVRRGPSASFLPSPGQRLSAWQGWICGAEETVIRKKCSEWVCVCVRARAFNPPGIPRPQHFSLLEGGRERTAGGICGSDRDFFLFLLFSSLLFLPYPLPPKAAACLLRLRVWMTLGEQRSATLGSLGVM